ncbi:MAG: phosphoribosylformylglycinamidine synthase subunit PurL [Methanosarcinales archaeon]|nr:phosphoribosylformylglycinamidine synthase subunit PurL [Methanosarcinales archaeon]
MLPEDDLKKITKKLGRKPTPVEEGCFINLWSEHCSYRSSAPILKTFTSTGERVIIGPGDDAAIVRLKDGWVLAIGMESHNHPSYVDPYNGAATGIGGIVRDVISMGARPIALMDPLYFGPLDNEKNRYLFEHVIMGIAGYGNCIGVPVVRGEAYFHESFSGNPLVNVVCVGLAREDNIVTATAQHAGNRLILMGSSTGRDGLGGASFASRDLSEESEADDRGSVQIGDPFTEKLVMEATLEVIDKGLVAACRDLGAAGLAGASSEMAAKGGLGAHIILDNIHLRDETLTPFEIMISESQERMVLEVRPVDVDAVLAVADKYDLKANDIGELTAKTQYLLEYKGEVVADIPILFLCEGAPTFERESQPALIKRRKEKPVVPDDLKDMILKLLSSPNIASREWIYRQYDHEVQVRTIIKPGGDAGVIRIIDDKEGLAFSCGCNPLHVKTDPYTGGACTVIENAMNLASVGAKSIALVDCLNFGNPEKPDIYYEFKQASLGLGDAARTLNIPVVGGNVSFYNESDEFATAIAPTPSIGMVGWVEDLNHVPASIFQSHDETVILIGDTKEELGSSEYYSLLELNESGDPPSVPGNIDTIIDTIISVIGSGFVTCAHDVSLGGLAVTLCEMVGSVGADIDLRGSQLRIDDALFCESCGRMVITTHEPGKVMDMLSDVTCSVIGKTGGDGLTITTSEGVIELSSHDIDHARSSLSRIMTD